MKTDHINCPIRPRVRLDDPDEPLEMIAFTIARYKFACKWMRASDQVIEVGCGEGFGCNFFSRQVASVTGMDIDPELVEQCRQNYPRSNLKFVSNDIVAPIHGTEERYDVVVSFEMIEHVSQEDGLLMVKHCANYLNAGGLFIMSTPRQRDDRSVSRQRMHLFEYDYPTLLETLNPHFKRVMVFCQNDEDIYAGHPTTAWNYVAVCTNRKFKATYNLWGRGWLYVGG